MHEWNPAANEIFLQAREHKSPELRRGYLDKACGDDTELRAEVESLLKASDDAGSFLESPPLGVAATVDLAPITEKPGTVRAAHIDEFLSLNIPKPASLCLRHIEGHIQGFVEPH